MSILLGLCACDEPVPLQDARGVSGRGIVADVPADEPETAGRARPERPKNEPLVPRRETVVVPAPATAAPASASAAAATSRADVLVRSVEASADPVVRCLAQHGGGGAEVAVPVDFEVSATGRVTRAEVGAPARSPLEACVRHAAEAIRFPNGEPTHFRYEYRVRREPARDAGAN